MRFYILFIVVSFIPAFGMAQDAIFSQYNSFPLYTNMAMAGSNGGSRIVMGNRLQWLNVNSGYYTQYLSYDQYSRHINSGFGVEYYNSNEHNFSIVTEGVRFTLSPHFSVNHKTDSLGKWVIKPAINFGFSNTLSDKSVAFGDMIDPLYGYIHHSNDHTATFRMRAMEFGTGALVYRDEFFGGFYIHHLTSVSSDISYDMRPILPRWVVHGGYVLRDTAVLGNFSFLPSFVYENQSGSGRLDLSLTVRYRSFSVGTAYRLDQTAVLLLGINTKHVLLGYSYEVNRLSNRKFLGNTHEFVVGMNFPYRKEKKKIKTLDFLHR